jgi:hypothetical protein
MVFQLYVAVVNALLEPFWACIGTVLGSLWPILGSLEPSRAILGLSWGVLGQLGAALG